MIARPQLPTTLRPNSQEERRATGWSEGKDSVFLAEPVSTRERNVPLRYACPSMILPCSPGIDVACAALSIVDLSSGCSYELGIIGIGIIGIIGHCLGGRVRGRCELQFSQCHFEPSARRGRNETNVRKAKDEGARSRQEGGKRRKRHGVRGEGQSRETLLPRSDASSVQHGRHLSAAPSTRSRDACCQS